MGEPTAEGVAQVVAPVALDDAAAGLRADAGERIIAGLIDGLVVATLGAAPVYLPASPSREPIVLVGAWLAVLYLLLRDGFEAGPLDRRSVGKRVMRLRPVRVDGRPMSVFTSLQRNAMLALGAVPMVLPQYGIWWGLSLLLLVAVFELSLLLADPLTQRPGDRVAGTRVLREDELRRPPRRAA